MNKTKTGIDFVLEMKESSASLSTAIDFLLYQADKILEDAGKIRNPFKKNQLLQQRNRDGKKSYLYILSYLLHDRKDNNPNKSSGTIHGELLPVDSEEYSSLTQLRKIHTNNGIYLLLMYLYKNGFFEDNPGYMKEVGDILIKYAGQFQALIKQEIESIRNRYNDIIGPRKMLPYFGNLENEVELCDRDLMIRIGEIIDILKSGSTNGEQEYIAGFYSFLIEKKYFTDYEIIDFLESGDDLENLFNVIDNILVRDFLGDFPKELGEILEKYLSILSNAGKHERYSKLSSFFQRSYK